MNGIQPGVWSLAQILLIDDDTDMTGMLRMILEDAGYDVRTAHTSTTGLRIAQEWQPNVIIVDMILPVMDGIEVCRRVHQISSASVIMLSVINKPSLVAQALDAGADDYLVKPVTCGVLLAHLNTLLRRAGAEMVTNGVQ